MFKSKGSHAKRQLFSGETVTVKDSRFGRIYDLKVYGKSYQQDDEPTPDNPSEILNVPSGIDFINQSKNFLPIKPTLTHLGVTFTNNGDGTYTLNGTATGGSAVFDIIALAENAYIPVGDYILSGCPDGGGSGTYRLIIREQSGGTIINAYTDAGSGVSFSHTNPDYTIRVLISVTVGYTCNNIVFRPMLRPADTSPEFEPYRRNVTPITIKDADNNPHTLGKWDYVDYMTGKIVKNGYRAVFDGSEGWWLYFSTDEEIIFNTGLEPISTLYGSGDILECFCNQAKFDPDSNEFNPKLYTCNVSSEFSDFFIYLPRSEFADLNAWKAHLAITPLVVEYEIGTPQVYDLHPDEKINKPATFEGDNLITTETDNGVKPELEFNAISYEQGE